VESITGNTITIKSIILNSGIKYNKVIAIPPATVTPQTNETINCDIEDANGNSTITILGATAPFDIFKFPITLTYPSGATDGRLDNQYLVATITDRKYRFLNDPNYNYYVWSAAKRSGDNVPNTTESQTQFYAMNKGEYDASCFQGKEIQLAQQAEVYEIRDNVKIIVANQDVINKGVKKSSLIIPHNNDTQTL